ncbi:hypothetical protein ACWEK5_32755 [Rhodococcus koreensis]
MDNAVLCQCDSPDVRAPAHGIDAHRYIDGVTDPRECRSGSGIRTGAGAATIRGRSRTPMAWGAHLAPQVDELRARCSRVEEIFRKATPSTCSAPAAWHPNREGRPQLRWWDGKRWEELEVMAADRVMEKLDRTRRIEVAVRRIVGTGCENVAVTETVYDRVLNYVRDHSRDSSTPAPADAGTPEFQLTAVRFAAHLSSAAKVQEGFVAALVNANQANLLASVMMITDQIYQAADRDGYDIDKVLVDADIATRLAFRDIEYSFDND